MVSKHANRRLPAHILCGFLALSLASYANGQSAVRQTFDLDWGNAPLSGPYEPAPSVHNFAVDRPNGNKPVESDPESYQYHHHTRVAVDASGRVWVAYSGGLKAEGESGQVTEVKSSTDHGHSWSQPQIVVAPQSKMDGSIKAFRRISYPRAFASYRGQLYLVAAIDAPQSEGCCSNELGLALVASAMHRDGSIGKPFRVSPQPYHHDGSSQTSSSEYRYDPELGPSLFRLADNFGTWGGTVPEVGSAPGFQSSTWTGYAIAADGSVLVEPGTISLGQDGKTLLRLWRDEGRTEQFYLDWSISNDNGATWTVARPTNIPNSPSESTIVRLANGNIAVIGNAHDQPDATDARDPLFLAVFDGRTGSLRHVYSVVSGLGKPEFDDGIACGPKGKPCGAAYPGAYEANGILWISYSTYKQDVWIASVPSASL